MPHQKDGMFKIHHQQLQSPLIVCNFWLRDHCRCNDCYGETSQRKININDIPLNIEPNDLKVGTDTIYVKWSDGHESSYNIFELEKHLKSNPTNAVEQCVWSAADIIGNNYASVSLIDYLANDKVAKEVVTSLIRFGCAFITNVPANVESTEIAIRRLFPIQRTMFGDMWSFSDNKARNDTAYTAIALPAHNDNTYFNDAAGLQVLHCVRRIGDGGENFLVDGFNVLKRLRKQNNEAFEYLSKICIPSEYIEEGYHFKHSAPVIVIDPLTNEPNQIRFNMNDRALFNNIPQEEMLEFYKHYKALATEIQREENEWRFKLEPGTVCIFDNWRLLHGRTEYTGQRQMVGCYVARNEFHSVARQFGIIQ